MKKETRKIEIINKPKKYIELDELQKKDFCKDILRIMLEELDKTKNNKN